MLTRTYLELLAERDGKKMSSVLKMIGVIVRKTHMLRT
jgi:hypothetical protein